MDHALLVPHALMVSRTATKSVCLHLDCEGSVYVDGLLCLC